MACYCLKSIFNRTGRKFFVMEENKENPSITNDCFEECKKTCKRNFWTEVLRTLVKVGTAVLAAFGLASCVEED